MVKKIVIADASPLIAFGRINSISILTDTLGMVIIPEAVAIECLADTSRPGACEIQKAIQKKIIKVEANPKLEGNHDLLNILGKGEAAAINLAIKLKTGLLIDEKLGRSAAKKLNVKVIGTAGVLLLAKSNNLIDKVSPLIYELRNSGYHLSSELIKEVLKHAKETD